MASFSVEKTAATRAPSTWLANAMAPPGSSSPAPADASVEEERQLLRQKMMQLRDVALDTKLELTKVDFNLGEILCRQRMERKWMEFRIRLERAWALKMPSSSSPIFRANLRVEHIAMIGSYDILMTVQPVNLDLLATLRKTGPDEAAGFRSQELKRKWALQEEELTSTAAKRAKLTAAMVKEYSSRKLRELKPQQDGASDLLAQEVDDDDDGKLCDVKRLDLVIATGQPDKVAWRRTAKETYKSYYPYADPSSREEYLTRLAERLAKQAEARGAALPTESEVIGYMLLDLLTTSAMSLSAPASFFLEP